MKTEATDKLSQFIESLQAARVHLPLNAKEGDEKVVGGRLYRVTAFQNVDCEHRLQWELHTLDGVPQGVLFDCWPNKKTKP